MSLISNAFISTFETCPLRTRTSNNDQDPGTILGGPLHILVEREGYELFIVPGEIKNTALEVKAEDGVTLKKRADDRGHKDGVEEDGNGHVDTISNTLMAMYGACLKCDKFTLHAPIIATRDLFINRAGRMIMEPTAGIVIKGQEPVKTQVSYCV